MYVLGKSEQGFDVLHMIFLVQYGLIKMCYGPSLGDIEIKELCQLVSRFTRYRIPPCAEWHHQLVLVIKYHISVHHGGKSYGSHARQVHAVFLIHLLTEI